MCLAPLRAGRCPSAARPAQVRLLLGLVGLLELVDVDLGLSVGAFLLHRGGGVLVGARAGAAGSAGAARARSVARSCSSWARLTAVSSWRSDAGRCDVASLVSALAARSLCEDQRVAGARWLWGTTSRDA